MSRTAFDIRIGRLLGMARDTMKAGGLAQQPKVRLRRAWGAIFFSGSEACLHGRGRLCLGRVIRRIVLSFALAAALSPAALAQKQADASADHVDEDYSTGETVFRGDARLTDTGILLTADEIRYNQKTQLATASGNVVFNKPGDRLLADTLTYNRLDGTFTATHLRVGRFPYYIEGPRAEGTRTEVVIHDAIVIYREPGSWQPTIHARAVTYSAGHYLRVSGANVGVGNYRPVPVMHIAENLARQSSLWTVAVDGGYRHSLGAYIDTGIHVPVGNAEGHRRSGPGNLHVPGSHAGPPCEL